MVSTIIGILALVVSIPSGFIAGATWNQEHSGVKASTIRVCLYLGSISLSVVAYYMFGEPGDSILRWALIFTLPAVLGVWLKQPFHRALGTIRPQLSNENQNRKATES